MSPPTKKPHATATPPDRVSPLPGHAPPPKEDRVIGQPHRGHAPPDELVTGAAQTSSLVELLRHAADQLTELAGSIERARSGEAPPPIAFCEPAAAAVAIASIHLYRLRGARADTTELLGHLTMLDICTREAALCADELEQLHAAKAGLS